MDLREGIINATNNKKDFTILLVGETGVGKTSFLSLIGNIVAGRKTSQYIDMHEGSNEVGGPESQSQTDSAKLYEFKSPRNGFVVRVLDTPGLADTRGFRQDEHHKASIAQAIQDHVTVVNAVLILANGTQPRLGVATDYTLSSLSSLFPRSFVHNIAFIFTNISSPLSWNFAQDSLPSVLRNADQFLFDNPLPMWKNYQKKKKVKSQKQELTRLRKFVVEGENKALDTLANILDWIDACKPQPTNDFLSMYQAAQDIEKHIQNALAQMQQAAEEKERLEEIKKRVEDNGGINDCDLQKFIKSKRYIQEDQNYRNMVCLAPGCYHNCHTPCDKFKIAPVEWCQVLSKEGCKECKHHSDQHRHQKTLWKEVERVVERDIAKGMMRKEASCLMLQKVIDELTKEIDDTLVRIGRAAIKYAELSLSGNFSAQIEKAINLMKINIATLEVTNPEGDVYTIDRLKRSMESMTKKLQVVKEAAKKALEKPNIVIK
ncbi:hypothetical protein L218DRAFT_1008638 [Marasmius fiardii PR-910]|nr:hypothetical protein L218DRAFT_1008638 [Marasmius fiardii PR-910]